MAKRKSVLINRIESRIRLLKKSLFALEEIVETLRIEIYEDAIEKSKGGE